MNRLYIKTLSFPKGEFFDKKKFVAYIDSRQSESNHFINKYIDNIENNIDSIENSPLFIEFKKQHEDYYEPSSWDLLISRTEGNTSHLHITIYNLEEMVFARSFYSITTTNIDKVLNLHPDVTVVFSIGDFYHSGPDKPKNNIEAVILNIHCSSKYGKCLSYMRPDQAKLRSTPHTEATFLKDCEYCNYHVKNNMDCSSITVLDRLRTSTAQERNQLVQNHTTVPTSGPLELLSICMSLGFNSHLTDEILNLYRFDPNIYIDIYIFEKSKYKKYSEKLVEKGMSLAEGSPEKDINTKQQNECKIG